MKITHDITFDVILLLTIFIHMTKVINNGDKLNVIIILQFIQIKQTIIADMCILGNLRCINTTLIYVYYAIKDALNTDLCILCNQRDIHH